MPDVKRTTVILEKKDEEFLQDLISQGKEAGIKNFIGKMFDVYRNLAMYDWKFPGEYYYGISRVAFVVQEVLEALTLYVPPEKAVEAGKKMGESLRFSALKGRSEPFSEKTTKELLTKARLLGLADFGLEGDKAFVKNPILSNANLLRGFMEGFLSCKCETLTERSPFLFKLGTRG
ncbi:MAG: hypothetical protein ACE5KO_06890 [Candidatus Bathyarchaeia archaeon]